MPKKREILEDKKGDLDLLELEGFGMHGEGENQCGEGIWMGKSYKLNGCGMLMAA